MIKLFTVKFGSHLYGTATPSSDIDYKTVYLPTLESLLIGEKFCNFKECPNKAGEVMKAGEVEIEYIALQRLAQDFLGNQSYALEIVFALDNADNIIEFNEEFQDLLLIFFNELISKFKNKNISPMVGYAHSQALKYGLKGGRLKEIEKLVALLETEQNLKVEIRSFIYLLYSSDNTKPIYIGQIKNSEGVLVDAVFIANKTFALTTRMDYFLKAMRNMLEKYGNRSEAAKEGTDYKALSHAVRISNQAIEFLSYGRLSFPLDNNELLTNIKLGLVPYEEILQLLTELNNKLEESLVNTSLREKTPELLKEFKYWLSGFMYDFYIDY